MKHYIEEEWNMYIKDLINDDVITEMENHLESCDSCFDAYMNVINSNNLSLIHKAKDFIGIKFTEKVMSRIESEYIYNKKRLRYSRKVFIYYTCAACITLLLMCSGAFNTMLKTIPSTTATIANAPIIIETSISKINFGNFARDNFKLKTFLK